MARRRTIPSAPAPQSPRRHAFKAAPKRGFSAAVAFADTGVLYAAARTRFLLEKVIGHYGPRLRVCDVVMDEISHRAASTVDASRQLEKNAAADAKRDLERLAVTVEPLTAADATVFDQVLAQLQALAKARSGDGTDGVKGHAGEAASIACCVRLVAAGDGTVLLTNDGDASVVSETRGIPSRHFGHVLNELVCAELIDAEAAFGRFTNAAVVSTPPASSCPRSSTDLGCTKASGICTACDAATS
jgi:hypothetical protein